KAAVVLFDVDQVDVVPPEVRQPPRQRGRRVLDRRGDGDDHFVGTRDLLWIAHAGAQEPERHRNREQDNGKVAIAFEVHSNRGGEEGVRKAIFLTPRRRAVTKKKHAALSSGASATAMHISDKKARPYVVVPGARSRRTLATSARTWPPPGG